jgi:uncharacterized phage infection (PIP) family protein YhgE
MTMGFLDQLSKSINQGVDRARFEAEKFQKTTRLQGEVNEFRRQVDVKLMELGQRAYDLQRAGQIHSSTIDELATSIDQLRGLLLAKEEELKQTQNEEFVEVPAAGAPPSAQQVPVSYDTPPQAQPQTPPQTQPQAQSVAPGNKACASCGFVMPETAMFCPNCGARTA